MLQVLRTNQPAIDLYKSLDFLTVGSMSLWQASLARLREIPPWPDETPAPRIRPLARSEAREAFDIIMSGEPEDGGRGLEVGTVITFPDPVRPGGLLTHRITGVNEDGTSRIDYRPVCLTPMTNDVQSFPPKARVY